MPSLWKAPQDSIFYLLSQSHVKIYDLEQNGERESHSLCVCCPPLSNLIWPSMWWVDFYQVMTCIWFLSAQKWGVGGWIICGHSIRACCFVLIRIRITYHQGDTYHQLDACRDVIMKWPRQVWINMSVMATAVRTMSGWGQLAFSHSKVELCPPILISGIFKGL